ncbi:AzlD domain-containing protein [Brasilonema bromeliae]|uniref:AzlD domain-containing protein n=1 Tax=Brasilonema bromeliae TaxID=383615 RepID=UPI001B7D0115|nr:AzlD domain-containing protein [Brasilonema bromeliae]
MDSRPNGDEVWRSRSGCFAASPPLSYTNARLVGASAAILISFWTKNLLLTIVLRMLIFFCWQWLVQLH